MSRQSISRANQLFYGRASLGNYQSDKPGIEVTMFYRFRPAGNRTLTFTGAPAAGATSATLSANWGGPTGLFTLTFSDGETCTAILTSGATTCPFLPATYPQQGPNYGTFSGLVNAVTSTVTVANTPPVLGVANCILTSSSINTGTPATLNGTIVSGGVATNDVARNIIAAWTGTAVMTVTGTDMYGQTQTESSASGTSFTGKKAFMTITAVNVSANVTAATVGNGNVLGLPYLCASGDFLGAFFNDAADAGTFTLPDYTAPATSTTGDPKGTYTPAGTLNGGKFLCILVKPKDPSTLVGSFGVTPA